MLVSSSATSPIGGAGGVGDGQAKRLGVSLQSADSRPEDSDAVVTEHLPIDIGAGGIRDSASQHNGKLRGV